MSLVDHHNIKVIKAATAAYLTNASGKEAFAGISGFIGNHMVEDHLMEMTGVISVSGNNLGAVYFTCKAAMLDHLGKTMAGASYQETMRSDILMEIMNSLFPRIQNFYGASNTVNAPIVFRKDEANRRRGTSVPAHVIPITWEKFRSLLITD